MSNTKHMPDGLLRLLEKVERHLKDLEADPQSPLDGELLNQVRFYTAHSTQPPTQKTCPILNQVSRLLPSLQQDPAPFAELVTSLTQDPTFLFQDVLKIDPPVEFHLALESGSTALQLMIVRLLRKAAQNRVDTNWVAGKQDIVRSLVRTWLRTQDTQLSQEAGKDLTQLLLGALEKAPSHIDPAMDQNLMWRRVFRDKDVYEVFFEECSLKATGEGQLSPTQKTIAQGRLHDWLLKVRTDVVRTSQIPEVEQKYGLSNSGGLLEYAAARMVDYEDDDLMRSTLINFCTNLIQVKDVEPQCETTELDQLKNLGTHQICISYYLDPNGSHSSWTLEASASYLATYCTLYRADFLTDTDLSSRIVDVLVSELSRSLGQQKEHLIVMVALPKSLLLQPGGASVLDLLPSHKTNPQSVWVLTSVFGESKDYEDRMAARALYFLYGKANPTLWEDIIQLVSTAALLEEATLANQLIGSLISSDWERLPDTTNHEHPHFPSVTEQWLSSKCNDGDALPKTGTEVILSPPALQVVVPYLMSRPEDIYQQKLRNMSQEQRQAVEKLSVVKHAALLALLIEVRTMERSSDIDKIAEAIEKRYAEGPLGTQATGQMDPTFYGALGGGP